MSGSSGGRDIGRRRLRVRGGDRLLVLGRLLLGEHFEPEGFLIRLGVLGGQVGGHLGGQHDGTEAKSAGGNNSTHVHLRDSAATESGSRARLDRLGYGT